MDAKGSGIISDLFSKPFTGIPKQLQDIINATQNNNITSLWVCRKPILSFIKSLLNIFSFGMLDRTMQKLGYDKLFHLYMVFKLDNGKYYRIEKNGRVNAYEIEDLDKQAQCVWIRLRKTQTLKQFFDNIVKRNIPNLFHYTPTEFNCQHFVKSCLVSNGLYNQKLNNFVMQDTKDILPDFVKSISEGITDLAGLGDYVYHAGRLKLHGGSGFIDLKTFDENS